MMKLSQVVRSGPDQYICQPGALSYLDEKVAHFKKPVIITGEQSYAAFLKHYPGALTCPVLCYDRTASNEDMARLAAMAKDSDCVIGIGGGKALDTAKGTAELLGVQYVMVPTVLGTCAAYTPVSAVYHPDHTFKSVDYYTQAAFLCLLDLSLLVESPKAYLLGGIGDTLAKWYEAEGITQHLDGPLPAMVSVGLQTAEVTRDILLSDSQEAIRSLEEQRITPAFERVVEAIIAVAGTVGGFAGEYGRMAGAHAVHNGMSLVKETHTFEHGIKVAYGILVQLAAAGNTDEVRQLQSFYASCGFPHKLEAFGVHDGLNGKMKAIADFASSSNETFTLAVPDATPDIILESMHYLEALDVSISSF
ncbi:Glycerol dehydrogenase [Alkalibacterium sp. AK22]|uniref:iron-containing alcohol dehydrogenase family protein n=1 Tax=Alkalibacterium sp. AK22 TaxID=1229520 RepID=UPI000447C440|nr:iron-containing alcohol dehydrogenase family protein [Alkalibacterium sp. AK22]EXJ23908.1 Glycerol dehydrogenase [Alkalibacterium sp. AK22]